MDFINLKEDGSLSYRFHEGQLELRVFIVGMTKDAQELIWRMGDKTTAGYRLLSNESEESFTTSIFDRVNFLKTALMIQLVCMLDDDPVSAMTSETLANMGLLNLAQQIHTIQGTIRTMRLVSQDVRQQKERLRDILGDDNPPSTQ